MQDRVFLICMQNLRPLLQWLKSDYLFFASLLFILLVCLLTARYVMGLVVLLHIVRLCNSNNNDGASDK